MAQSVINIVKHAVAGSTRLAATNATGGDGIADIKVSKDLDNGTIIGKGALIAGEVYAMTAPTTFTGKIIDRASNGNWLVEVLTCKNAYLVLTSPSTPYDFTIAMSAESTFYNEKDSIARAYKLHEYDVFELSTEGFDGTPVKNASVAVDSTTYQVEIQ